jgi:hypothetical protein
MLTYDIFHALSFPVSLVRIVETNDSMVKNFKMKFNDFRSHPTYVNISQDEFFVEVNNVP